MATFSSLRVFRIGMTGLVTLSLGAGGHMAGGGGLPEPLILLALCSLTLVPVAALSRFRFSFPVLLALLAVGQAWLHWGLDAFAPVAEAFPSSPARPVLGHHVHEALWEGAAGVHAALPSPEAGEAWGMIAAHICATLATALLLSRGEDAVRLIVAWLRPLVRLPKAFVLPPSVRLALPSRELVISAAPALRLPCRRGPRRRPRPAELPGSLYVGQGTRTGQSCRYPAAPCAPVS